MYKIELKKAQKGQNSKAGAEGNQRAAGARQRSLRTNPERSDSLHRPVGSGHWAYSRAAVIKPIFPAIPKSD